MFDIKRIIKNTTAYKILKKDKEQNSLSHAYIVVSKDSKYLKTFLKIFAKLICCKNDCCEVCRTCNLIENENHLDVSFLPKEKDTVVTADVDFLINDAYVKPYEEDKKILNAPENPKKFLEQFKKQPVDPIVKTTWEKVVEWTKKFVKTKTGKATVAAAALAAIGAGVVIANNKNTTKNHTQRTRR